MEMHQIKYFLAVCSERNFTRAARFSHVSQPSLTRAIKLLEAELGGPLFRREHANSRLTELGEIIRPHLQEVWQQTNAAITHAHDFSAVSRSRLKIGIMWTIAPVLLTDLLTRARTRYQAIELQIVEGSASELHERLLGGEIGAAIYGRPEPKVDARLVQIPLFREQLLIAMPRNHRLAGRSAIRIADLAGERYVRRPRCEYNELFTRLLRQHRVECEMPFSSERDDWALALIARDFGLGLCPQHVINHPGVVAKPLAELELRRQVDLVVLQGGRRSDGVDALIHEAKQSDTLGCFRHPSRSPDDRQPAADVT